MSGSTRTRASDGSKVDVSITAAGHNKPQLASAIMSSLGEGRSPSAYIEHLDLVYQCSLSIPSFCLVQLTENSLLRATIARRRRRRHLKTPVVYVLSFLSLDPSSSDYPGRCIQRHLPKVSTAFMDRIAAQRYSINEPLVPFRGWTMILTSHNSGKGAFRHGGHPKECSLCWTCPAQRGAGPHEPGWANFQGMTIGTIPNAEAEIRQNCSIAPICITALIHAASCCIKVNWSIMNFGGIFLSL